MRSLLTSFLLIAIALTGQTANAAFPWFSPPQSLPKTPPKPAFVQPGQRAPQLKSPNQDHDGDMILSLSDNCPSVANPNQMDTDGDKRGDACDNCPANFNPWQGDVDQDGVGNMCETCATESSGNSCQQANSKALAAGRYSTCALRQDHSLWCWGFLVSNNSESEELEIIAGTPQQVGAFTDIKAVALGGWNSIVFVRDSGDVWRATISNSPITEKVVQSPPATILIGTPQQVAPRSMIGPKKGEFTPIADANTPVVGFHYAYALRTNQTIFAWHHTSYWNDTDSKENKYLGEIGSNSLWEQYIWYQPSDLFLEEGIGAFVSMGTDDAIAVAAGGNHACALRSDRTVWCWGVNQDGLLGIPKTKNSYGNFQWAPDKVEGVDHIVGLAAIRERHHGYGWQGVVAGPTTCALRNDGKVYCWGLNVFGALGTGGYVDATTPQVVPNLDHVTKISGGYFHICALKDDGTVWCWGNNELGQLGDGTIVDNPSPQPVNQALVRFNGGNSVDWNNGFKDVAAGGTHTCAIDFNDEVWCWGDYVKKNTIHLEIIPHKIALP